ncbi:nuclear transport factor 2 family protein [Paenarthrobacter sp. RAF54_2]|uniref:nuclear transport factor 2 family protein n=1 Tax=Paenarthrobacter sp. RAF54_2 TaxID=3233061 RepID=UPI003F953C5F
MVQPRARERPGRLAQRRRAGRSRPAFHRSGNRFSDCTAYSFELQAYDVVGDLAYTAGLERSSISVTGQQASQVLRATQVYRREDGEWKVAHRHADTVVE